MIKHGVSHALATLVTAVSADLMAAEVARRMPELREFLVHHVTTRLENLGVFLGATEVKRLLIVVFFGFAWGAAFRLATREHRRGEP